MATNLSQNESQVINLDTLNMKQKAKEFKSTQKDIKSKELPIKLAAIEKCQDRRYISEGSCLSPLILSIIPKKKNLEYSKISYEKLSLLIDIPTSISPPTVESSSTLAAFSVYYKESNNLDFLKVISDAIVFKEEIKKVKKPKGKKKDQLLLEEAPPVILNPDYKAIRTFALKSLYRFMLNLYTASENDFSDIKVTFASIENLHLNLFTVLSDAEADLVKTPDEVIISDGPLQMALYALMTLVFVLKYNNEAINSFISKSIVVFASQTDGFDDHLASIEADKPPEKSILTIVHNLSKISCLTNYCLQIMQTISKDNADGLDLLSTQENKEHLLLLLNMTSKYIIEFTANPVPDVSTGNNKGKDDKSKKKEEKVIAPTEPVDEFANVDKIKIDPKRWSACSIRIICMIFTKITNIQKDNISDDIVKAIGAKLSVLLINKTLWEIVRDPLAFPLDESITDVMEEICILLGSVGLVSYDLRKILVENDVLTSLLSLFKQSLTVVSGVSLEVVAPPPEKPGKGAPAVVTPVVPPVIELNELQLIQLNNLRRICEQVILILIANSKKNVEDTDNNTVVSYEKNRWNNGQKYITAEDILNISGSDQYTSKVVDMIAVMNDEDLSNRSCRILSAILVGLDNSLEYIIKIGLESILIETISKVIQERGLSVVDQFTVETNPLESTGESIDTKNDNFADPVNTELIDSVDVIVKEPSITNVVDLLIPNKTESLYYMTMILEILLLSSTADNIKTFGTVDRVKTIVSLLKCLGPCCCSLNLESSATTTQEFQPIIYDPREYSWRSIQDESTSDIVYIRPILIDILSLVTYADQKFRTYEGDLPAETLKPLPASKSPCEESSLTVCKYASDVLYSILSNQTNFTICCNNLVVVPAPDNCKLPVSLLHAALRLVKSISTCGPIGLAASLDAIAESGFSNITTKPDLSLRFDGKNIYAMKLFDSWIQTIITQENTANIPSEWKRPIFFDEIYNSSDYLTSQNSITTFSSLWPFIVISSCMIPLISDPNNSNESSFLAIEAIKSMVLFSNQNSNSQPALADIIAATFISLGGGVALTGIVGKFGNIAEENREYVVSFISYLLQRGKSRKDFWNKWAEDNKEVVVLDPKTGKPIPKKDDKKAAAKVEKKDPKAIPVVQIIPEIVWNLESSEEFPDPNHGPDESLWINIMNIKCDDLYEKCISASLLTSAVQGGQSDIALELIDLGVDVNQIDGACLSAIMYSLCLGNVQVTKHLISHGADVNALDNDRNPVIKYALLSISTDDISLFLPGFMSATYDQSQYINLFGTPSVLDILLESNIDVNVCDTNGYNPLLISLGLGRMTVVIGGYKLDILSAAYNNINYNLNNIHSVVTTLLDVNCWINFCSVDGIIPMHIAAARGDLYLINNLALRESIINALDCRGLTPLHYLSIATPSNCVEVFDALMELAVHRPLDRMIFDDYRTGQSEECKNRIEVERFIKKSFSSTLFPESIGKLRLVYTDLLHKGSDNGINLLQYCMCASDLFKDHSLFSPLLFGDKDLRMTFALHLLSCAYKVDNGLQLLSNVDVEGMSVLHSASLLFKGITPKRELTDREKRSKRVKTYPSKEIHLIELILACPNIDVNGCCYKLLDEVGLTAWNAMHAAIYNNNSDLMSYLVDNGLDIYSGPKYLNYLIQSKNNQSDECIKFLVNKLSGAINYKSHFNEIESDDIRRPLLMAVRNKKINVIKVLVNNPKIDLNIIDETTNTTAFHEACLSGSMEVVQSFRSATDRIDLLATGKKNNCIIDIIENNNTELLLELISMRRNDVIETLVAENGIEPSYLIILEEENIKLAKALGYNLPSDNNNNNEFEFSVEEKDNGLEGIASMSEIQKAMEEINIKDTSNVESDDNNYPSDEMKGEVIITTKNIDEPVFSAEEYDQKFKNSNNLLKILIDVVNSTGIITESHHAHRLFFDGKLIVDNTDI